MPIFPGLVTMPTVVADALLSLWRDRSLPVEAPDTLAVVLPMYNEGRGAGRALVALLNQDSRPEHVAVSLNGCTDDTRYVVEQTLTWRGYRQREGSTAVVPGATVSEWRSFLSLPPVTVVTYPHRTAKSVSINNLVRFGVVAEDRLLLVDGDTVLRPGFIAAIRRNFYRLYRRRSAHGDTYLLEDFGLQSGAVMSFIPDGGSFWQRLISFARRAEYALAAVLRSGQTRMLGKGALLGRSRLYTVIGCGFAARRDLFPVPEETLTEDHDFTLASQASPSEDRHLGRDELARKGFRFHQGGRLLRPGQLIDAHDRIVLRKGGNARFVAEALMDTEDPPHPAGLFRQVERWNGGGIENALKRLSGPLTANVRYAVWSSQSEDLLGIVLLTLAPLALALHLGNPTLGLPLSSVLGWLAIDAGLSLLFTSLGFYRFSRAEGASRGRSTVAAVVLSLGTLVPFIVLRSVSPFAYLASITRVVPEYLQRRGRSPGEGVTWDRPHQFSKRTATRTHLVFAWSVGAMLVLGPLVAQLGRWLVPVNHAAFDLTYRNRDIDPVTIELLPFSLAAPGVHRNSFEFDEPMLGQGGEVATIPEPLPPPHKTRSVYCDSTFVSSPAPQAHALQGDPDGYQPLGMGQLLVLARLAPLGPLIERAATSYDIPVGLLLKVLINESYLDPFAIGPTGDLGLSQMTDDALTMLKGLANDPDSRFYNPRLIPENFNVFDPDFSICAGAAKLAWALGQPQVDDEREAYALYINPIRGFVNGRFDSDVLKLTEAMVNLEPLKARLADLFAAYRSRPEVLSDRERALMDILQAGRDGLLSLEQAYRATFEVVTLEAIPDATMYQQLLSDLYASTDQLSRQ